MQRLSTAVREFLAWHILRRLQRGDAFWTPPGGSWRIRRLASLYRVKRERAIRAVIDEFMAELDALVREERARHNLAIGFDPLYRVVATTTKR